MSVRNYTVAHQKRKVYEGEFKKTASGLSRDKLIKNKHGEIVSRKKHDLAKKSTALKTWVQVAKDHGYLQKGKDFKQLPAKGTQAYKSLKKDYNLRK